MSLSRSRRWAVPAGAVAMLMAAGTALADFHPSVPLTDGSHLEQVVASDLATRGRAVGVSVDRRYPPNYGPLTLAWSGDSGATWRVNTTYGVDSAGTRDAQVTVCGGHVVAIYRAASRDATPIWSIATIAYPLDDYVGVSKRWGAAGARGPDIACVANDEVVSTWFERGGDGWDVRVRTRHAVGPSTSPQSFGLGGGTPSRGLAIATSSTRVYVAWFEGHALKLRRFAIGGSASHTLTNLGTTTIATLPYGNTPKIGADGDRVVLAYSDRADLKVRRSTDRGGSFGSAVTLRDEPFPSEIGALPTTVSVRGSRVAIGALEIGGIDALVGRGLGYRSTDGGGTYDRVSSHLSGRIVAGLVKAGTSYRFAEAWDQSITDPDDEVVRFRRQ
jgi:hypothetical protein